MVSKEVQMMIYLNIGACFVGDFHAKFSFWVGNQIRQNVQINSGAQIVNIWQEDLKFNKLTHANSVKTKSILKSTLTHQFFSSFFEFFKKTRVE